MILLRAAATVFLIYTHFTCTIPPPPLTVPAYWPAPTDLNAQQRPIPIRTALGTTVPTAAAGVVSVRAVVPSQCGLPHIVLLLQALRQPSLFGALLGRTSVVPRFCCLVGVERHLPVSVIAPLVHFLSIDAVSNLPTNYSRTAQVHLVVMRYAAK